LNTLKKYNDFLTENLEKVKDKIAANLEEQETDDDTEQMKTDIEENVNKQIENINKKKELLQQKIKMMVDQITLIDNTEDKALADDNLNKLKTDLSVFDEQIKKIQDQKEMIEK